MERQSSFGSQSSAGSAFTSKSATTKLVNEAEKENAIDGQAPGLLTALFGALYTLAKEKINDTASIAMLAIWVDFLFIFTLLLMPDYPWVADAKSWIYQVFYYIQIHMPIANTGYTFYLAIFYILVAILFISVAICIWVGWCFMNDNFPFLWPIKVARVVVSLFVTMFYIASLNIFLTACTCWPKADGKWEHMYFKLDCLAMPHLVHAVVSLTSGVVFFVVAILLVLGDHELEPMSRSWLAAPHSMCELRSLLCKTVITISDILLKPWPHLQTVLYTITCGLIFYYQARMVPHYVPGINVLRGGLNAILAWCALMGCILTYTVAWQWDKKHHPYWDSEFYAYRQMMTTLMAIGVPVSFLAGAGICWGHLMYAWKAALKFKVLPDGVKPRTIHRFWSEFDVEVASRIGRVWDEEGVLDQTALEIAENVLKAGVAMNPKSVFMHIAYSNFLIDVRHNAQSGWNQLDQATSLGPNLSYQFSIFTRKQEHKQKSGGGGGGGEGGAVDLVSYVEFQKNYKSLLVYHKASLVAQCDFWRLLTREKIPLDRLGHSFSRMDEMESKAAATYKIVLDRYPSNAKLLRSYAKFLESIKNDPWGAARYYAEAEKQEELEESRAADIQVGEETVSDKNSGILTINATGIIQMANKVATQLLGYKRGELTGKNVSILMPPPFSTRHNTFLRNYVTTSKAKILDSVREVVALHKDRYVFPCTLKVTRFSGTGVDSMFMGLMKPLEPDGHIRAWLLPTGTILCADSSFMDYAGWAPAELVGRAFSSLAVDNSVLDDLIAQTNTYEIEELDAGALQISTRIKHKYGDSVPVHIKVTTGGTAAQRILVLNMRQLEETAPMGAFDQKGQLVYVNSPLAALLGYQLHMMKHKDITQLMPQPYGVFHLSYLKDTEHTAAKAAPGSCRSSMTTIMLSSNNTPVYVIPTTLPQAQAATVGGLALLSDSASSGHTCAFKVQRSSQEQYLNERRLMLGVTAAGRIMWTTSSPDALFGVQTQGLIGQDIGSLVDVFAEYCSENPQADIATALAALLNCSSTKPGTSWRVGVGRVTAEDKAKAQDAAAAAVMAAAAQKRIVLRQASHQQQAKPAVMTVTLPGDDSLPEQALSAGADVAIFIELWRADLLMAAAEVAEKCSIVRAEPGLGLVFGVDHARMLHHNLGQFLALGTGTTLPDLMGTKGPKKGGMKGAKGKTGPVRELSAAHSDGRPMTVSVQAALKDAHLENRLVLAVKPVKALTGAPHMLSSLIAAEAGDAPEHADTTMQAQAVPGLALEKLTEAAEDADGVLDLQRGTHRSNVPGSNLVTARLVDVDMAEGEVTPGRAPAHLADSPTGSHEVDRDMDISSGDEEVKPMAAAPRKKKHLTGDEREAELAAKGANKAREWLELEFGGYKKTPALPGAVEDLDASALFQAAGSDGGGGSDPDKTAAEPGKDGSMAGGSEATTGVTDAPVSDYGRGKRLRKLVRLLSSKAALQVVVSFRFKVILLVLAICVIHLAAFSVLVGFLSKQYTYLDEVEAAGDVLDLVHRVSTLSVVLEAAQRGQGFAAGNIPRYAAEMEEAYNRLNTLHEGLYLGFSGLRTLEDPKLYSLWHDSDITATTYLDAANPTVSSVQTTSLFALGGMVVSAAKELQFAVLNPDTSENTGPLATLRSYHFLHANGPGTLYEPYVKTLDLMAAQAEGNAAKAQLVLLALLCTEGVGFMALAIATIIRLLGSIRVHRMALFSVFLAVPHTFLRTLASKSVSISAEDGDEEEEDDKAAQQAAEEARKKSGKQQEQPSRPDWGSVPGNLQQAIDEKKAKRSSKKAMFADDGGDAAVQVSVKGPNASGKGAFSMGPFGALTGDPAADRQKLFNGKELVTSAKSAYQLSWPILVWGTLLLVLYGISYDALSKEHNVMVYTEMMHKSRVAASRVTYFALRANLETDPVQQAHMQTLLEEEAEHLQWVYGAALYGTANLKASDSSAHGDFKESTGSLFSAPGHKHLLFDTDECLRYDQSTCLDSSSPFYQVTHHGLDSMVLRLTEEAKVMTRSNVTVLGPDNPGFQFVYTAAWYDLHDGFSQLLGEFFVENKALFNSQRTIHIILVVVMVLGGGAFLLLMLRPFLRHISKESRRCAELLVQLPPDFDVEGMVAATWGVVKNERLLVERSGRTFFETGGVMGTLRELSKSFLGPRPPLQSLRLSAMGPDAGEDKLFTPRYADGPRGGGPKASPSPRGTPRRRGSDADFFDSVEDEQGIGAGEGGRGGLRHRPGHGPAGMGPGGRGGGGGGGGRGTPRGASHSRRAIVPVDDDLL